MIAEGDIKLSHLAHRAECSLTVFELSPPFMGIETRGAPELIVGDVTDARRAIASRYVGPEGGIRFAARRNPVGTVVRLRLDDVRAWVLSPILPSD